MNLDKESQELEHAYPGILARLESEPLERLGKEHRIPKSAPVSSSGAAAPAARERDVAPPAEVPVRAPFRSSASGR